MTWLLWVFWVLVLVALVTAAATAKVDATAHEISDECDKDMGRKPCEGCDDV